MEIKRGLVKNLTTQLIEVWVYSADVAQQRYDYFIKAKGPNLKIGNDYELKEYIEKSIKQDKKSPEVIAKGDIFDIKPKDMIYNKKHKDKNKDKAICEKVPPEKSIDYRPEEANNRSEYGHWEGDLVVGKRKKRAVLLVFTERMTREEIIIKVPSKKAEDVARAIHKLQKKYKKKFYKKFKIVIFDNGGKFRNWNMLEKSCRRKEKKQ